MRPDSITLAIFEKYSPEELADTATKLVQALTDQETAETEKKTSDAVFKERIGKHAAEANELAHKYSKGGETAQIGCRIYYDRPTPGKKSYVRMDSEAVVEVHDMNLEERQETLQFPLATTPAEDAKPKKNGKPKPEPAPEEHKQFHGRGPDKIVNLLVRGIDPYGAHPALTSLGPLIRLVVGEEVEFDDDGKVTAAEWVSEISFIANGSGNRMSMEQYRNLTARLDSKNADDVRKFRAWLASAGAPDVAAVPNTRQLYFLGGRQNLTPAELAALGSDPQKDICDLGECFLIEYFAQKRFDRFEPTTYFHEFGEETDERPRLIFMRVPKLFLLAGGEYTVKPAGITN